MTNKSNNLELKTTQTLHVNNIHENSFQNSNSDGRRWNGKEAQHTEHSALSTSTIFTYQVGNVEV